MNIELICTTESNCASLVHVIAVYGGCIGKNCFNQVYMCT